MFYRRNFQFIRRKLGQNFTVKKKKRKCLYYSEKKKEHSTIRKEAALYYSEKEKEGALYYSEKTSKNLKLLKSVDLIRLNFWLKIFFPEWVLT